MSAVGDVLKLVTSVSEITLSRFALDSLVCVMSSAPMELYVIITVNHDAAAVGVDMLVRAHPLHPREVVLQDNQAPSQSSR